MTMLGVANCSDSTLDTPLLASSLPVSTDPEVGVFIRFSLRRRAVMTNGAGSELSDAAGVGSELGGTAALAS